MLSVAFVLSRPTVLQNIAGCVKEPNKFIEQRNFTENRVCHVFLLKEIMLGWNYKEKEVSVFQEMSLIFLVMSFYKVKCCHFSRIWSDYYFP
jgi:hypothetical protein